MRLRKFLALPVISLLAFALVEVPFSLNAHAAGMIATSRAVADFSRQENIARVNSFLERKEVQAELEKRGVSAKEAEQRIASLSDFELQKIAGNIETAPAGAEVVVIGLTTLLLIIIIILLLGR